MEKEPMENNLRYEYLLSNIHNVKYHNFQLQYFSTKRT